MPQTREEILTEAAESPAAVRVADLLRSAR